MKQNKGKMIIIVAPSGTGKSSLIIKLLEKFPQIQESLSYTTRPKREGDIDGRQYFFLDSKEFESKVKADDFLEWALVHSNYYGTSKSFVEKKRKEGKNLLFDLDVQGTDSFKNYFKDDVKAIFISPPSIEILKERLEKRATDTSDVISHRLQNAQTEMMRKNDYDYLVINDDFDHALTELSQIFNQILGAQNA